MVTVANLKDQTGQSRRSILHCVECGAEYSANAGDYWDADPSHVFKCCGAEMELVVPTVVYVPVEVKP